MCIALMGPSIKHLWCVDVTNNLHNQDEGCCTSPNVCGSRVFSAIWWRQYIFFLTNLTISGEKRHCGHWVALAIGELRILEAVGLLFILVVQMFDIHPFYTFLMWKRLPTLVLAKDERWMCIISHTCWCSVWEMRPREAPLIRMLDFHSQMKDLWDPHSVDRSRICFT